MESIIKSTAQPDNAMKIYELISCRDLISGKYFTVTEDCENDYHNDQFPIIPAGTIIKADFGGDFGLYALASFDGKLHKVKFKIHEVHKINFGEIPDNICDEVCRINEDQKRVMSHYPDEDAE